MKTLAFFLEEPSAREMLKGLIPRIVSDGFEPKYIVFQGKRDLEKQLEKRLKGWRIPNTYFVVIRDQDAGDCRQIKRSLQAICHKAGRQDALVRVACRELEAFYLGDLKAVARGLDLDKLDNQQGKTKYRDPDRLRNPAQELKKLTKNVYQKVSGSRAIGPHLSLQDNRSSSFRTLLQGIRQLTR